MPDVDNLLSHLAGGRIFFKLDLSNCFLQIPLSQEAKEKTAFVTEAKFERMPFGLKGAPAVFQKLMNLGFKDLKNEVLVHIYLNDIIIPFRDWDNMLTVTRRVLISFRAARLTLKPTKCTIGATSLNFLGFTISSDHIKPEPKVEAIKSFPRPSNAHEVRHFLGIAGYFRRFIVNYAVRVSRLKRSGTNCAEPQLSRCSSRARSSPRSTPMRVLSGILL